MKYWGVIFTHVMIQLSLIIKFTAQKIKFFIKDFFSKCDQIRRKLSYLLKKSLTENFIFCAALPQNRSTINVQDSAKKV